MRAPILFAAAVSMIAACSPSAPRNDVGPIIFPDAWAVDTGPRPDTGPPPPPTCGGTATACADRALSQCEDGAGCALARCRGTPRCIDHSSQFSCNRDVGCSWDGTLCSGIPDEPCGFWTSSTNCFEAGCTWNDFDPPCLGTPSSCESLHGADCLAQLGCHALDADAGPPDGGADAGHDAGGNDAAVLACTVTGGTCSPFSTTSCGANQTCIANGTPPHCTVSAITLRTEGQACTTDNECAWGLECHSFDAGATFQCTRFCHAGSTTDCGPMMRCNQLAYTGSTCLRVCAPMAASCDLALQNCATGSSCYVYFDGTAGAEVTGCYATGTVPIGGSCAYLNDCVRGASCFGGSTGICRETCDTTADCSSGTCTGASASHHYCM